ncbi:MAG: hypothetical protein HWN66_13335 [Candidatus Helarchaeota archaeon]|nr:hypothetical protein [Candidatus Helarchaeota archaeon]
MIHHVWLINRAGVCILDRNYTGFRVNRQLFSGFLTALNNFALQLNQNLDSLSMGEITIYYELDGNLIVAIAVDRDDNDQEIRRKIRAIREEFQLKYGNILEDWDGNLNYFDSFVKDFDRILMLDWNFDYDLRIKSKSMKPDYPTKNVINISQRGIDLFEALREKGVKSEE